MTKKLFNLPSFLLLLFPLLCRLDSFGSKLKSNCHVTAIIVPLYGPNELPTTVALPQYTAIAVKGNHPKVRC